MAKTVEIEVSETEFKSEVDLSNKTWEQEQISVFKSKCKEWAAACEVEIDRIERENGVRIGNSTLAEAYAKAEIKAALQKIQSKYLSLC